MVVASQLKTKVALGPGAARRRRRAGCGAAGATSRGEPKEGGAEAEEAEAGPTNHPEVQVENLLQLEDASDWDAMMGGDSFSLEDDSKALGAELDAAILALRQPGKENVQ